MLHDIIIHVILKSNKLNCSLCVTDDFTILLLIVLQKFIINANPMNAFFLQIISCIPYSLVL